MNQTQALEVVRSLANGVDPDTGSESGDEPACRDGAECLAIPAGWNGPIAAIDALGDAAMPTCEGAYATAALVGFDGLAADPAQCECSCAEPLDVSCPATASLRQYDNNIMNCAIQQPANIHPIGEGCSDIPFYDDVSFRLDVPDLDLAGVSCDPQSAAIVPPTSWTTQVAGCSLAEPPALCGGGTCVPQTDDPALRLCVWAEGDVACSGDVFTERQVLHQGVDDSRSCSECECGDPEGSCTASFNLRSGDNCTAGSPGSAPDGECLPIMTPARSVEMTFDAPAVACAPSGGEPGGSATPIDAVTICCAAG